MRDSQKAAVNVAGHLRALKRAGTPARAKGAAAYFKAYERLTFFGVDSATVRRMAARIRKEEGRLWTLREAVAFTDAMVRQPQLEAKGLGIAVLGKCRTLYEPWLLPRARRWLARHCTDWASADLLCGEVIGPLLQKCPELIPALRTWRSSRHLYVRRASAVALLPLVRRGHALDHAYQTALILGSHRHHLLQKAAGWALREAGRKDMSGLDRFLLEHGPRLSRKTVTYAIERFPPARRRQLLAATRAPAAMKPPTHGLQAKSQPPRADR
jgi:3-methyladenine DNA glycosylase AlkD